MSTKATIAMHGPEQRYPGSWHLYEEVFDERHLYLSLEPAALVAVYGKGAAEHPPGVVVRLPRAAMLALGESLVTKARDRLPEKKKRRRS